MLQEYTWTVSLYPVPGTLSTVTSDLHNMTATPYPKGDHDVMPCDL